VLGKPGGCRKQLSLHPIDREFRGSVGKPVFPFGNGACAGVGAMALLDETRLTAERARLAKYRLHHVGTKLNEGELREFEALVAKRGQTQAELIRGLILEELKREPEGLRRVRRWSRSPRAGGESPDEEKGETRYVMRYVGSCWLTHLQGLTKPSGSCKYLKSLALVD